VSGDVITTCEAFNHGIKGTLSGDTLTWSNGDKWDKTTLIHLALTRNALILLVFTSYFLPAQILSDLVPHSPSHVLR
tara:strand:+ start:613 stop:843 length:231 start_codon:yes stop_codon:yes gene_type:complete